MGVNHHLPLFHTYKNFVYLHNEEDRINEFAIRYMVNSKLSVNKVFKYQAEQCMNYLFAKNTQPATYNDMKKILPVF